MKMGGVERMPFALDGYCMLICVCICADGSIAIGAAKCNRFRFTSGKGSSAHQTCNVIYCALYLHAMIIADTNSNFVQHIDH